MTSSQRGALAAAIVGSAIVLLDGTIVNVALPAIGSTLPSDGVGALEGQVYVVAGYMAVIVLGPPIGGALVEAFGWRSIFLVNGPLVAVGLGFALQNVPEMRAMEARARFDWFGAAIAVVAVGGLSFGAIRGQQVEWSEPGLQHDQPVHVPDLRGALRAALSAEPVPPGRHLDYVRLNILAVRRA